MQAIHTKYIPATNTRAAKIKAYNHDHPRGICVSDCFDLERDVDRHYKAAQAFIICKLPYAKDIKYMAYGGSADGKGYSFCFTYSTVEAQP